MHASGSTHVVWALTLHVKAAPRIRAKYFILQRIMIHSSVKNFRRLIARLTEFRQEVQQIRGSHSAVIVAVMQQSTSIIEDIEKTTAIVYTREQIVVNRNRVSAAWNLITKSVSIQIE